MTMTSLLLNDEFKKSTTTTTTMMMMMNSKSLFNCNERRDIQKRGKLVGT